MAALLGALVDLGYGVGYRVLDAQFLGVPQRRRRVFILGLRGGPGDPQLDLAAECAAAVLSVGTGCERHPAKGGTKRKGAPDRFADGTGGAGPLPQSVTSKWFRGSSGPAGDEHHNLVLAGSLTRRYGKGVNTTLDDGAIVLGSGASADPGGVRGASGLPGGLHDRAGVEVTTFTQNQRGEVRDLNGLAGALPGEPGMQQQTFVKVSRPSGPEGLGERWAEQDVSPTLNNFDNSDTRAVTLAVAALTNLGSGGPDDNEAQAGHLDEVAPSDGLDDPLLPLGLDSARYRVLGNAVCVPVAEWLGHRLAEHFRE